MSLEALKQQAAEQAVKQIENGMVVGLGTGSTTRYALAKIGALWLARQLIDVVFIPTSKDTAVLAREHGLPLATLTEYPVVDLAIDGADEIDPQLNLIKGLGGALLREKIVEIAAKHFIVIADESKLVEKLGLRVPLPVEVTQFAWPVHRHWLTGLGCRPMLRGGECDPYVTDNGNYILDCAFPDGIDHPNELATILCHRPGILEHGLFLRLATQAIVATSQGIKVLDR